MRLRSGLVILAVAASVGASAPGSASYPWEGNEYPCVSYDITAPGVGHRTDTQCSPQSLPPSFTGQLRYHSCRYAPPAGVVVCTTVELRFPPV